MMITTGMIREFVERCYNERGYCKQSLMNAIALKLHRGAHSLPEAEILPHIHQHLSQQQ